MSIPTPNPPGLQWFTWPFQFAQAFLAALPKGAPDNLAQNINPWSATVNINSNNSSAPDTEQSVLARHSYGRQLGRLSDVVALLVEELDARDPAAADDKRIAQFRELQTEIEAIKVEAAVRRLARIAADLEALRGADAQAYERLKARLRDVVRD
jgi:hypothetical protein